MVKIFELLASSGDQEPMNTQHITIISILVGIITLAAFLAFDGFQDDSEIEINSGRISNFEETEPTAQIPRRQTPPAVDEAANIEGNLLLKDEKPVANTVIRWQIRTNNQTRDGQTRTNALGRFLIPLAKPAIFGEGAKLIVVKDSPAGASIEEVAFATLPSSLVDNLTKIGSLYFEPAPIVAAGQIIDQAGKPISAATLAVSLQSPKDQTPVTWSIMARDIGGNFALRQHTEAKKMKIKVSRPGYITEEDTYPIGKKDWFIQLQQAATLSGVIEKIGDDFEVIFVAANGNEQAKPNCSRGKSGGISFRFTQVFPGQGTLFIKENGRIVHEVILTLKPGYNKAPFLRRNAKSKTA